MANMSYCRFENTYHALFDCLVAFTCSNKTISELERSFAKKLYETAKAFTSAYEEYLEDEQAYIKEHSEEDDDE